MNENTDQDIGTHDPATGWVHFKFTRAAHPTIMSWFETRDEEFGMVKTTLHEDGTTSETFTPGQWTA